MNNMQKPKKGAKEASSEKKYDALLGLGPKVEEQKDHEFKINEEEVDKLAIATGEKPPLDLTLAPYTQDGEPQRVEDAKQKVRMILAKDKKFFQRGIVQFIINGRSPVNLNVDLLISAIYNVYDVPNPYKDYNPSKPMVNGYGVIVEEDVAETKDAPAHKKRELKWLGMSRHEAQGHMVKIPGSRVIEMVLAIEESSELSDGESAPVKE